MPVTFTDDDGVVWDVWEVVRSRVATFDAVESPAPGSGDSTPQRLLCFLSARGKRQLDRYPRFWSVLSDAALQRLCRMAEPVSHSEIRPHDDQAAALLGESPEGGEEGLQGS